MHQLLKEDSDVIALRRYTKTLEVCGKGTILFAAWNVIKITMYFLLNSAYMEQVNQQIESTGLNRSFYFVLYYILMALFFFLYYHVGISAVRAAGGAEKGCGYLILSILLLALSSVNLLSYFEQDLSYTSLSDTAISVLLELTSDFILIELIFCAVKTRNLRKRTEGGSKHAD